MAATPPREHSENASQISSPSKQTPPSSKTSLLDLPPELRNRIYEFTLLDDIYVFSIAYIFVVEPGLIRCNKQVRKEAYSIFWSGNTFNFPNTLTAEMSLALLHRSKIAALRLIRVGTIMDTLKAPDWLDYVKSRLRELSAKGEKKGMRPDAIKMPLKVKGEDEICWVTMREAEDFGLESRRWVVRKAAPTPR